MSDTGADSLLFIEPVFQPRVWGGTVFRDWFGPAAVPEGPVGEAWAISAMPGQSSRVRDGCRAGATVDEIWRAGVLTGRSEPEDFPILIKFLDAQDWLSVQVHPDDSLAARVEGEPRGKAESWYVVENSPGARLVLGHAGAGVDGLRRAIHEGTLEDLLVFHDLSVGDFYMVPAGVIHALGPGAVVYEVQQSSDTTYRLYDYGRAGLDGEPRELHIEKGLAAVTTPFDEASIRTSGEFQDVAGGRRRPLVSGPFFNITEYRCSGELAIPATGNYRLGSAVAGSGSLGVGDVMRQISRGESFISPAGSGEIRCSGEMTLIITEPGH